MLDLPDTTHAQLIVWATTILTSGVLLFGLDLTDAQKAAIIGGLVALVNVAHLAADAWTRSHRVPLAVALVEAGAVVAEVGDVLPPDPLTPAPPPALVA
jgi:hypothetical protein